MEYLVWTIICAIIVVVLASTLMCILFGYSGISKFMVTCYEYDDMIIVTLRNVGTSTIKVNVNSLEVYSYYGHEIPYKLLVVKLYGMPINSSVLVLHPGDVVRMYIRDEENALVYRVVLSINGHLVPHDCINIG